MHNINKFLGFWTYQDQQRLEAEEGMERRRVAVEVMNPVNVTRLKLRLLKKKECSRDPTMLLYLCTIIIIIIIMRWCILFR